MKKLLITTTAVLACVAAFAQGKVNFINDSLHTVYFTTDTGSLLTQDAALAGAAVPTSGATTALPSGGSLAVDLWAGTSASTLVKVSTTSFYTGSAGINGTWNPISQCLLPFAGSGPSGSPDFFQIQIYSASAGSFAAASSGTFLYYGESSIFTAHSSTGTPYYSIVQTQSPGSSTWAIGTYDDSATVIAGAKGAIMLQANVPEPTTLALAGLGVASLLAFRRRK